MHMLSWLKTKTITIVIPVYNESVAVEQITASIRKVLDQVVHYTILFIDDGSTDDTLRRILALCQQNHKVKYISLSRNFGHQNAIRAGLDYCKGDAVVIMDGDMQHPPKIILSLLENGLREVRLFLQQDKINLLLL